MMPNPIKKGVLKKDKKETEVKQEVDDNPVQKASTPVGQPGTSASNWRKRLAAEHETREIAAKKRILDLQREIFEKEKQHLEVREEIARLLENKQRITEQQQKERNESPIQSRTFPSRPISSPRSWGLPPYISERPSIYIRGGAVSASHNNGAFSSGGYTRIMSADAASTTSNDLESAPLVFIGGGNMAAALIKGCANKKFISKNNIVISVLTEKSAQKWKDQGYDNVFTNTLDMLQKFPTAIYIICVKPQVFEEVVSSWPVNSRPKFIISVMAGVPLKLLSQKLPFVSGNTTIVRLMPNVASSIGSGASTLCYDKNEKIENQEKHIKYARRFAECVGSVEVIPERAFNAAMSIGGSSPAWTFMYIESLADGAVAQGLGRAEAKRLAAQAVMGAAKMLLDSESGFDIETQHMGVLKDKVCSPGGTTIEGVRVLEKNGFRSAIIEAVVAASQKADDMAKALEK